MSNTVELVNYVDWYRRLLARVLHPINKWVWSGETKTVGVWDLDAELASLDAES